MTPNGRLLVAALALSSCEETGPDHGFDRRNIEPGCEADGGVADAGSPDAGPSPFTLTHSYVYPSEGARVPLCTDDVDCVAVCHLGALDGGDSWQCRGHDGGAFGTVTDPGTCVKIDTHLPGIKAPVITGSCAPKVNDTAITTTLSNGAAHTVVMAGYGRLTSGYSYWFAKGAGDGYYQSFVNSGQLTTVDYADPTVLPTVTFLGAYGIFSHSFDGAMGFADGAQSTSSTTASLVTPRAPWANDDYWFGTKSAKNLWLGGPLVFWALYADKKSTAELEDIFARYWGVDSPSASGSSTLRGGPGQPQGLDNTATTGNVDMVYGSGKLSNARGLLTSKGHTNVWATDAADVASWADVGTPTVDAGVSSGPLAAYKNAPECDLVGDDDGAAFEGKQSASAGTTAQYYNASCWLKAGSLTTARITIDVTGGTGSTACDFTGLVSTASRKACATLASSATSIKASVLVGNAASDTGSIQVCQCQLTKSLAAEPPAPDNSAHGDTYYTSTTPTSWPSTALGGKYEVCHTSLHDPSSTWVDTTSTYYLFDVSQAGASEHSVAILFGYQVPGRFLAAIRGAGSEVGDLVANGVGLTPGQMYCTSVEWRPVGGGLCTTVARHDACGSPPLACAATTVIAQDSAGVTTCPGQPVKMTLGNRYNGTVPGSMFIHAVRVFSL